MSELTNMHCQKAQPKEKPYNIADSGNLYLRVTPTGGKLWRWNYRFQGKMKTMSYGKYPDVSLAMARARHAEARRQLADGIDPMGVRKEKKHEQKAAQAKENTKNNDGLTVEKITREWFKKWSVGKDAYNAGQVERLMESEVLRKIGDKHPNEVTRREIIALIESIVERGRIVTAKRTLMYISMVYRDAMHREVIEANPASAIEPKMVLPKPDVKKMAHVEINAVPDLLRKMRAYEGNPLAHIAMELVALTFLRSGNILKAAWVEIDWTNKLWRIPAERMKKKRPHLVPLSKQVLDLLYKLKETSGKTCKLFPAQNGEDGTICNKTILKAMEKIGYKGCMTGHGWRHIASTFLRGKNYGRRYDKWIVEAQMAHVEGGVAGIYNEAEYLDERTEMMQHWADALDKMRETDSKGEIEKA